ncbi:MAG: hypothetical protein WCI36_00705 [bacterium]
MFKSNKKQGSILAYSLIVLGMMLSIAVAISSSTIIEKKSASATSSSVQSLQTADSGAQLAIKTINAGSNLTSVINTIPVFSTCDNGVIKNLSIPGAGRYDLYLYSDLAAMVPIICNTSKGNDVKIIKSVATYNGTARSVSVKVGVDCTGTVSKDGITYGKVLAEDGRCWLDRNLGAKDLPTSATDDAGYGWYFQWGRKADGHQYTAWGGQPSPLALSSVIKYDKVTIDSSYNVVAPYTESFIESPFWLPPVGYSYSSWLPDTQVNTELWLTNSNTPGISNPCPDGFHIPTFAEWDFLLTGIGFKNCYFGFDCKGKLYSSKLKLVPAGFRTYNGTINHVDTDGHYYSSTAIKNVSSVTLTSLFFGSNAAGDIISSNLNLQATAMSVRCIAD